MLVSFRLRKLSLASLATLAMATVCQGTALAGNYSCYYSQPTAVTRIVEYQIVVPNYCRPRYAEYKVHVPPAYRTYRTYRKPTSYRYDFRYSYRRSLRY